MKAFKNIFLSALLIIIFQPTYGANPPIPPSVSLDATDKNTKAEGDRKSQSQLMMVADPIQRKAEIKLTLIAGELCKGYPKWSGNGVEGSNGSFIANWSGTLDTTVVCEYAPGETKSIGVVVAPISNVKIDIGSDDLNSYTNKINAVIKLFADVDDPPQFEGSIEGNFNQFVDYFNNGEKLGSSIGIAGELALVVSRTQKIRPVVKL